MSFRLEAFQRLSTMRSSGAFRHDGGTLPARLSDPPESERAETGPAAERSTFLAQCPAATVVREGDQRPCEDPP